MKNKMTIKNLLDYGYLYQSKNEVRLLLATILNINSLELNLHLEDKVDEEKKNKFYDAIDRLNNGEPLQYILSNANFYGYDYYVNKNVLIPRFETEELVYQTLEYLKHIKSNAKVLDLCTGSGCIGLTLKQELNTLDVTMSDISKEALEVTKINKDKYNVDCQIIESDLFENITGKFDCIISNPPYISRDEEVMELVKNNEPELALYSDNNGLDIYERIFKDSKLYLNENYLLAFELNSNKSKEIYNMAEKYFLGNKLIIKKDNYGRDRMLFILKDFE